MKSLPYLLVAGLVVLVSTGIPAQDSILLKDGRSVMGKPVTKTGEGFIVHYDNGDVKVGDDLVKSAVWSKTDGGAEREWTPEEQEKIDKGYVFYEGSWVPERIAEQRRERARKKREEMIEYAAKHRKWANHRVERSRNFEFHFTVEPEIFERYRDVMEEYFKVFSKQFGIRKPRKVGRLQVNVYHDYDYFLQVTGVPNGVQGFFRFVPPYELHFYFNHSDPQYSHEVMCHEMSHFMEQLMDTRFAHPAWISEGMAEYYGASEWDPDKKELTVGLLQEGRIAVLKDEIMQGNKLGLREMMEIPRLGAVHYAWAWSFCHFMLNHPKYGKRFETYFPAIATDSRVTRKPMTGLPVPMETVEPDVAIEYLLALCKIGDLDELEKEWHAYIDQLDSATARGYSRAGQRFLQGDLPLRAIRYLEQALEMGYDTAATRHALGEALYEKKRYDESLPHYERAIELDPLNGIYYIDYALAKYRISNDQHDVEVDRLMRLAEEIASDDYGVRQRVAWWRELTAGDRTR